MGEDNDPRGRKPRVDISDFRNAIRTGDTPVLDVGDLADAVGLSRAAVNNRMDDILADDAIQSKKVGQTRVFWHANLEGKQAWVGLGQSDPTDEQDDEIDPSIGKPAIDNLDLPGEGETLKLQRAAIWIALDLIHLNGKMRSKVLKHSLWNYPFTQAYSSCDGFWNNVISPSLSEIADNYDMYFDRKPNAWYSYEGKEEELNEKIAERHKKIREDTK